MESLDNINRAALWDNIKEYAIKAGRIATRPILLLYFVMKSKETPFQDKVLIFSTLSYLVLPVDILNAKRMPVIGWFDEIASMAVTYKKVRKNITPAIEAQVDTILDRWFPCYAEYVELPA